MAKGKRCYQQNGFSIHTGRSVNTHFRDKLEELIQYSARSPISNDRMKLQDNGKVQVKLKTQWSDGATHLLFTPLSEEYRWTSVLRLSSKILHLNRLPFQKDWFSFQVAVGLQTSIGARWRFPCKQAACMGLTQILVLKSQSSVLGTRALDMNGYLAQFHCALIAQLECVLTATSNKNLLRGILRIQAIAFSRQQIS